MKPIKVAAVAATVLALAGCATVDQEDLNAWVGVPVEALDTHSFFLTLPVYRSVTSSGMEVRNYANGKDVANCFTNAGATTNKSGKYVNSTAFTTCSSNKVVCNNIFYIKDGKVVEYAPTGNCYTDETVRPQARYLQFRNK
jgi:predicted metal-binding protein